jgi:L-serine/L-threonine ammonia-lyase
MPDTPSLTLAEKENAAYVHPFDHPTLWAGHATLIEEVKGIMPKPGAVVVAVGGGGLLCGILTGLHQAGWADVPVLAVETEGAASFAASVKSGKLMTLDKIDSIATSLGARRVAQEALNWTRRHQVNCWTVSDRSAVQACLRFADDHRVLVEPACGAALAVAYERARPLKKKSPILVVVCGGAGVTREKFKEWESSFRPIE